MRWVDRTRRGTTLRQWSRPPFCPAPFLHPHSRRPYLCLVGTRKPINKRTSTLLHAFHAFDERKRQLAGAAPKGLSHSLQGFLTSCTLISSILAHPPLSDSNLEIYFVIIGFKRNQVPYDGQTLLSVSSHPPLLAPLSRRTARFQEDFMTPNWRLAGARGERAGSPTLNVDSLRIRGYKCHGRRKAFGSIFFVRHYYTRDCL